MPVMHVTRQFLTLEQLQLQENGTSKVIHKALETNYNFNLKSNLYFPVTQFVCGDPQGGNPLSLILCLIFNSFQF